MAEKATPDFPMYGYYVPADIADPAARAMYWDMMNRVRAKPWVHRFVVSDCFKQLY